MKRFTMLLVAALSLISLGISTRQVNAYGNTYLEMNCPMIHLKGYSDSPHFDSTGPYVIGDFRDMTTGTRMYATIRMTGRSGTFYTFNTYVNLLTAGPVYSGDQISVYISDSKVSLADFRGTITTSILPCGNYPVNTTPPSPSGLKLITCSVDPLAFPGGVPRPQYHLIPGNARYVDPRTVTDAYGNLPVRVQVEANIIAYIPPSCVGADVPVPMP